MKLLQIAKFALADGLYPNVSKIYVNVFNFSPIYIQ